MSTHARPDSGSQVRIFFRVSFSVVDGKGPTKMIASRNLFSGAAVGLCSGQDLDEIVAVRLMPFSVMEPLRTMKGAIGTGNLNVIQKDSPSGLMSSIVPVASIWP